MAFGDFFRVKCSNRRSIVCGRASTRNAEFECVHVDQEREIVSGLSEFSRDDKGVQEGRQQFRWSLNRGTEGTTTTNR